MQQAPRDTGGASTMIYAMHCSDLILQCLIQLVSGLRQAFIWPKFDRLVPAIISHSKRRELARCWPLDILQALLHVYQQGYQGRIVHQSQSIECFDQNIWRSTTDQLCWVSGQRIEDGNDSLGKSTHDSFSCAQITACSMQSEHPPRTRCRYSENRCWTVYCSLKLKSKSLPVDNCSDFCKSLAPIDCMTCASHAVN